MSSQRDINQHTFISKKNYKCLTGKSFNKRKQKIDNMQLVFTFFQHTTVKRGLPLGVNSTMGEWRTNVHCKFTFVIYCLKFLLWSWNQISLLPMSLIQRFNYQHFSPSKKICSIKIHIREDNVFYVFSETYHKISASPYQIENITS